MPPESSWITRWTARVQRLKTEIHALSLACRDPRVPRQAKLVAILVVAYALSPIDLIPDFIPVFGYLDDLIILPLGILLCLKMIPAEILQACREQAGKVPPEEKSGAIIGALIVVTLWLLIGAGVAVWAKTIMARASLS
ncbi:hypothetical protein DSCO28_46420 [Desulfosarcina ovata subsp. sediminis]|uniref:DUF1232 domain-containing protein n=1 Tax=Desulfosarcina ovata subsp. sediminis TaxID=885957 RepID=A0A5K7ZV99_9BACT|nr:YkvA family protein [Desulfosarcina ovata]BBO84076.1 hypothetical protein DSCO28_46420 [Desulfosarcina ovata subsp. sediminis]